MKKISDDFVFIGLMSLILDLIVERMRIQFYNQSVNSFDFINYFRKSVAKTKIRFFGRTFHKNRSNDFFGTFLNFDINCDQKWFEC